MYYRIILKIPKLKELTPQTNNIVTKVIGRLLLWSYRWHIEGEVHNAKKFIVILAPHTSRWDFLTNMSTMLALGVRNRWFVANEFCWWPLGNFMRWLGGIPIQFLAVDYKKRASVFGPVFEPSNDIEADMKRIQTYFKDVTPKTSENYSGEYF